MNIICSTTPTTNATEQKSLKNAFLILDNIIGMGNYKLSFIISYYKDKIVAHYQRFIDGDLVTLCHHAEIPYAFDFNHFGLLIECTKTSELALHNTDMHLNDKLKPLI
jgi:hypothetical protein